MSTARFELFSYWRTSATYRVRVAFNLKGIPATERFVDLDAGDQHGESFRKVNPMGGIPALLDHESPRPDLALTQSLAILEYLEEVVPRPALLPPDPYGRARVRSIALMMAADTHPLLPARVKTYLTGTAGLDAAAFRAWQTHWFTLGLQALETRFETEPDTGRFCHGDQVTIADICLASIIVVMRVFDIVVPDIPRVQRIMTECEGLDAFVRADPKRQAGAPGR